MSETTEGYVQEPSAPYASVQNPAPAYAPYVPVAQQNDPTVSIGMWVGVYALALINLIPFLGPIGYIIVLCVIAFGNNSKPSLQNWAKAMLIIMGVLFVLGVIFTLAFWGLIVAMMPALDNPTVYY